MRMFFCVKYVKSLFDTSIPLKMISLSLSLSLSLSETTVSWRIFFDSFFFVSFFIVSFTSKEEEDKDRIEVTRHLLLYMKNHRNLELFSKKKKQ